MAFEMICGQCRGNLLVEQFGVVVACPHCGAHLSIPTPEGSAPQTPAPAPLPTPAIVAVPAPTPPLAPEPIASEPIPSSSTSPVPDPVPAPPVVDEQLPFFGQPTFAPPENADLIPTDSAPVVETTSDPAALFGFSESTPQVAAEPLAPELLTEEPVVSAAVESATAETTPAFAEAENSAVSMSSSDSGLSALIGGTTIKVESDSDSVAADAASTEAEEATTEDSDTDHPSDQVSNAATAKVAEDPNVAVPAVDTDHVLMAKTSVLLLLSYTSAVTIGFLYLFFHLMSRKDVDYGLESLPDLVPKKKNVSILLVPERAEMPDGHELKIGQSQKFGNIKVTVTKVTRGPIQFVHHSRKSDDVRLPSSPVLKLWLKFENVSQDQEIPPLDSHLLFTRSGKTRFDWRANQFVCREEDKANTDKRKVYVYDHNFQSPWDLANLPLEKPLKPKESRVYYVPSGENDLELLTGSLLWRVHFRKGYGPKGRGVTTIFEVHFDSGEIKDEQA